MEKHECEFCGQEYDGQYCIECRWGRRFRRKRWMGPLLGFV